MRKNKVMLALVSTMVLTTATACSPKAAESTKAPETTQEATTAAKTAASEKETEMTSESATETSMEETKAGDTSKSETSTITGTLSEVKDFMFILEDGEDAYVFPISSKDEISDFKAGDNITVTYTGVLDFDEFTGTIVSIVKAK